jgi:hypothetical protein
MTLKCHSFSWILSWQEAMSTGFLAKLEALRAEEFEESENLNRAREKSGSARTMGAG